MPRIRSIISSGQHPLTAQAIVGTVQSTTLTGSSSSDARLITSSNVLLTGGSGGAILPPNNDPGNTFRIVNASGNTCTLYPPSGATINGTTSLSMATAKSVMVVFMTPTDCRTIPVVAS